MSKLSLPHVLWLRIVGLLFLAGLLYPSVSPAQSAASYSNQPFPESTYTTINDVEMHYRWWTALQGQSAGNILLVHGFGGSTYSWRKNINFFRKAGYNVLAVDLPGFGYSERELDFNHGNDNRAQLIWQLIEKLEANNPTASGLSWHLIGHSMGASTVAMMSLQKPDQTAGLILVNGALYHTESLTAKLVDLILNIPPTKDVLNFTAKRYFIRYPCIEQILTDAYGYSPDSSVVQQYLKPLQKKGTVRSIINMAASYEVQSLDLNSIVVPTLLLWGENDDWITTEEAKQIKTKIIDAKLHIMPNSVHCPMETDPTRFNHTVLKFLQKNNGLFYHFSRDVLWQPRQ